MPPTPRTSVKESIHNFIQNHPKPKDHCSGLNSKCKEKRGFIAKKQWVENYSPIKSGQCGFWPTRPDMSFEEGRPGWPDSTCGGTDQVSRVIRHWEHEILSKPTKQDFSLKLDMKRQTWKPESQGLFEKRDGRRLSKVWARRESLSPERSELGICHEVALWLQASHCTSGIFCFPHL